MRLVATLILFVVACGSSDQSKDQKPIAPNEDEDPCDPKQPKVCVGNSVVSCEANGRLGRRLRTCKDGCKNGRCAASCDDDAVKLIYLVDDANNFLSYDPRKSGDPFRMIGKLDCGEMYSSPFSMSVDREGIAWVLYQTGNVYKVDIRDAKCTPSGYVPSSSGSTTFGMGFSTDEAGGKTEKLYISTNYLRNLAAIDTTKTPPISQPIGPIDTSTDQNPELTGTSEGKLFGFFPVSGSQSFIQEIDKKTGKLLGTKWSVGQLGSVGAWAFAQWGGIFFVFVTVDGVPQVRAVDRRSGEAKVVMESIPYRITGAGVSTCAPELDKAQSGP